ncbi:hypothetical protein BsWGS_22125 [Bradybaena similaris]
MLVCSLLVCSLLVFTVGVFTAGVFTVSVFTAGVFTVGVFTAGVFTVGVFTVGVFTARVFTVGVLVSLAECGELNPSDIYFTFSPADLDVDSITWTTSFIGRVISAPDMDVGFRYGVVSGSCPNDAGFDLDTYSTVEEYKSRLEQYNDTQLPQVIKRLLGNAYSAKSGGRAGAGKVAVIVASGDTKEAEELSSLVDQLVKIRVKVYIADPSYRGLKVKGAVTLIGRSSHGQAEALISFLCPSNPPPAVGHDC